MMSASAYKLLHFLGIFMTLLALGGIFVNSSLPADQQGRWRRLAGLTHGIGLVIVLVAGFGLLARLELGFELWVSLKLLIWLAFGALIVAARKHPGQGVLLWWTAVLLAVAAAYLGHYQPF